MNIVHNLAATPLITENRLVRSPEISSRNNSTAPSWQNSRSYSVHISDQGKTVSSRSPLDLGTAKEEDDKEHSFFAGVTQITAEEHKIIQQLQQRDAEVRAHEQAHVATAGQYAAGAASYTYETGPNGKRYAVGGEVPIDVSKESTPEETLQKMQVIAKAAMAPLNPSAADRRIAARAAMISAQARMEIQQEKNVSTGEENITAPPDSERRHSSSSVAIATGILREPPASKLEFGSHLHTLALKTYQSMLA